MRISPINNNQTSLKCKSNPINFNGKFMKSEVLNEYLKLASDSDLQKFNTLLKRMKTQNDNLVFTVNSFVDRCHEYCKTLYIELEQFNEKLSKKRTFDVGTETVQVEKEYGEEYEEEFSLHITGNVIKRINDTLERRFYPKQKVSEAERKALLEEINMNLN